MTELIKEYHSPKTGYNVELSNNGLYYSVVCHHNEGTSLGSYSRRVNAEREFANEVARLKDLEKGDSPVEKGDWVSYENGSGNVYLVTHVLVGGYVALAEMPIEVPISHLKIVQKNNRPDVVNKEL